MAALATITAAEDLGLLHWGSPAQPDLFGAAGDPRHLQLAALRERLVRFASGLSREKDFSVAAWAGHPIGVEVGELSAASMAGLARAVVDHGSALFVDSGAFGVFMRQLRGTACAPLDFHQVLARYDALLDAIADYNVAEERIVPPLLVMPDVVDDQLGSIALIRQHREWIRAACFFSGVSRPIIPIQRGPLPLAEAYRQLVDIVESDLWVAGIPSNAAAITPLEFTAFLADARPKAVHILGALADSRLNPRVSQILDSGIADQLEITSDGNPLRSIIIRRGQGADDRRAALAAKLGRRARLRELNVILDRHGGHEGVRARLVGADPDARRRLVLLLADLADAPPDVVAARYGVPFGRKLFIQEFKHAA